MSLKCPLPSFCEENVAFVYAGNEKILVAGIIYVAESGGDADAIFQTDAGSLGNVFKFSVAEIAPEFIAAKLIYEINIIKAVAVHVCHGNTGAVVVVNGHIKIGGIRHGAITERDAALLSIDP